MPERVSVVPRRKLVEANVIPPRSESRDQGLFLPFGVNGTPSFEEFENLVLAARRMRRRSGLWNVEHRPTTMEQIATYGVIMDGNSVLVQEKSHADPRLQHSVSIGVGGHMDEEDFFLKDCLQREFWEEKAIDVNGRRVAGGHVLEDFFTIEPVGLIKDTRDAVGRRHVGVVFSLVPHEGINVLPNEEKGYRHGFVTTEELRRQADAGDVVLAGWTQIVLDAALPLVTIR